MAEHGGPNGRDSHGKPGLQMAAMMYPTPTARDCKGANSMEHLTREGKQNHTGQLANAVKLFPTPMKALETAGEITEEDRWNMTQGNGGQLNPDWVEWLMGFPVGWTNL